MRRSFILPPYEQLPHEFRRGSTSYAEILNLRSGSITGRCFGRNSLRRLGRHCCCRCHCFCRGSGSNDDLWLGTRNKMSRCITDSCLWCEARYSRVGNFRKSTIPRAGGHFCKLIWFWARNMNEQINLFMVISGAMKTSHNLQPNNCLLSGRSRTFSENIFFLSIFVKICRFFEIFRIV